MSILLTTVVISQLCYDPKQDIGDRYWLSKAQLLEQELVQLVKNKKANCIDLTNKAQLKEAKFLVKVDASGKTIIVK
ncbi:hypothetical protein ACMAZF_14645 [Psychrobium sp. nBUS_13]|uniref:hypothetical protein n=1 Tax=Psychrobium sp. nBUS_13 TaxID=3395319 RepID=UPI003EC09769|tara:strand:- start:27 stop:257 length:231 start_codon:yes stop_codon:yes gene_type:complete